MRHPARLLIVFVMVAAACGSTVQRTERRVLETNETQGSEVVPGAPGEATQSSGSQPSGTARSRTTRVAGSGVGPQAIKETDPIRMGFIIIDLAGAEKVLAGFGTQVSFGDGDLEARALVRDLNRHGGIAGRKVEGFYRKVNPAAADPGAAYIQGCTQLTEDDKVFVIITVLNVTQGFVDCVGAHKTLLINVSFNPGDDHILNQHVNWLHSPPLMSLDRGTAILLNDLRDQGKLGLGAKVGIVVNEADPQLPRVSNRVIKPTLTAWGVPFLEAKTSGQNSSNIANAVLQFNNENVNRVIFEAPNGLTQLQFMNFSEDQQFHPQYSFWDPDSPKFVSEAAPRNQARNITGIGALPVSDVAPSQHPHSPEEQRCLAIFREAGEGSTDRNSNLASTLYCEGVWAFQAVTEKTSGILTTTSWKSAYPLLGTTYRPVSTFGINFSNGRNDNASHYRRIAWNEACTCMTFTSPPQPAPL